MESLEGTLFAQVLNLVDDIIATISPHVLLWGVTMSADGIGHAFFADRVTLTKVPPYADRTLDIPTGTRDVLGAIGALLGALTGRLD